MLYTLHRGIKLDYSNSLYTAHMKPKGGLPYLKKSRYTLHLGNQTMKWSNQLAI